LTICSQKLAANVMRSKNSELKFKIKIRPANSV